MFLRYLVYLVNLLRLRWILYRTKRISRFDKYTPHAHLSDLERVGISVNQTDWELGSPNLERNENVNIVASNTLDEMALNLSLKWRPNAQLGVATILSRLRLEFKGNQYDYEEVSTYQPSRSSIERGRITEFGQRGSSLKLTIVNPYRRYRLVFRGRMRRRDAPEQSCFVKLSLQIQTTSKMYDFREQLDPKHLAKQVAGKQMKGPLSEILNEIMLHDRHEHTLKLIGDCTIQETPEAPPIREKLHLWGFQARHFVTEQSQQLRYKRILGLFNNGRAFHVAVADHMKHNLDSTQQVMLGYVCFLIEPMLAPLSSLRGLKWDQVRSNSLSLNFELAGQEKEFSVSAQRRSQRSEFFNMTLGGKTPGWGHVLINDSLDASDETQAIRSSCQAYKRSLESGWTLNPELLDSKLPKGAEEGKALVVSIERQEALYSSMVGAKASSLAQMRQFLVNMSKSSQMEYVIPDAVMVTRFAYEAIQAANPRLVEQIRALEARVGRAELESLGSDCERLQQAFEKETKLPESVVEQLAKSLQLRFSIRDLETLDGRQFAVRSSSWGEDEVDMSAAGQLTTVLAVQKFQGLKDALLTCFASKFAHTNIEYKRQHGLPLDLPMALVVQEMIDCDKAGVLFTCEPTSGDPSRLTITANYGLGESVVSGATDPDCVTIRLDTPSESQQAQAEPSLRVESVQVGQKRVVMSCSSLVGGEGDKENQPEQDKNKCCLEEAEMMQLARCGLELANYFRSPRDIEWGFKDGQLYLFQSRPITSLETPSDFELMHEFDLPSRAERDFMTRANVGEVMPYPTTPLLNTFAIRLFNILINRIFINLGKRTIAEYSLTAPSEIVNWSCHTFFSLRSKALFNFAKSESGSRSTVSRAFEVGLFGHEINDPELIEAATDVDSAQATVTFERLRFDIIGWRQRFIADHTIRRARANLKRIRRDFHSMRFAGRQSTGGTMVEGLMEQLHQLVGQTTESYMNHALTSLLSTQTNFDLVLLLSKYIKDPVKLYSIFSKFLSNVSGVLSAEIPRRIEKMAKTIGKRGIEEVQRFVEMTPTEGFKYLTSDLDSELAKQFDSFMSTFGHRCYNEFEIAARSWRDTPEKIVEMLQTNARRYLTESPDKQPDERPMSLDELIDSLNIPFSCLDRLRLRYLVAPRSQQFVRNRERTKDCMIEMTDILRDATRLLGRQLRQINRLPDEDLIYFLAYHELIAIVREPQPSVVVQATRRRKMFKQFDRAWHFDEICKGHDVLPLHLKPSSELQAAMAKAPKLKGVTASSGRVEGKVCLVNGYAEINKVKSGDILLAYSTDIAFSPIFPLVSGVITEIGGLISHGAVVAREYGLPSVIGIEDVTKILRDGERIILDADNGLIIRLEYEQDS